MTYGGLDQRTRRIRQEPHGLWLVDRSTWAPRLLEADAPGAVVAGRWILWQREGNGLVWWNARTGRRREAFATRHLAEVTAYGDRALVRLHEEADSRLLDLRRGRVLGSRRGSPPAFLIGRGSAVG